VIKYNIGIQKKVIVSFKSFRRFLKVFFLYQNGWYEHDNV